MENEKNSELYSKVVRAGKRTYFFDIKATRGNDLYITLTESKKTFGDNGNDNYEKHKIFLYKEDFEKFKEGLEDVLAKIDTMKNNSDSSIEQKSVDSVDTFTSVSFEDL